jgi:hypothetical protein
MVVLLCCLLTIALFCGGVMMSREAVGPSTLGLNWILHGFSALLILIALATPGIWYDATTYLGDLWTAFDAIRKTQQGLLSSIDYFSPIGPAHGWIYEASLWLHPPSARTIVLANVLVAALALMLALFLLRNCASPLTVGLVGIIAVTTALTPRDIDLPGLQSSFLAPYNRWCWALLMPVAMRSAVPITKRDVPGTLILGTAIALLLLLKVTYGVAALGILMVAVALQPRKWKEGAIALVAVATSLIVVELLTGGQIRAYLNDLSVTAQMSSNGLQPAKLLYEFMSFALAGIGSLIVLLAAVRREGERPLSAMRNGNWRAAIIAAATGGAGLIVLMQNHYNNEATALLLMPLIVAEWSGLLARRDEPGALWYRGGEWIALLLLVVLARPAMDAGMVLAQPLQLKRNALLPAFARTEFHDLVIEDTHLPAANGTCSDSTCKDYSRMVRGRLLIQRHCPLQPGQSLLAANFSNPFPALTGSASSRRGAIWFHAGRTFSTTVHLPYDRLFEGVDCLMEARSEPNGALFMQIYGTDLIRNFKPVAQDETWTLWKRNGVIFPRLHGHRG